MKKIIYSLIAVAAVVFTSCQSDKGYDDLIVTHFTTITLNGDVSQESFNGDQIQFVPLNSDFQDPGATAMEGDEDVTSKIVTTGSVDATKTGGYYITYSAANKDGFANSVNRLVIVYDPATTVTIPNGIYTVAAGSNRTTGADDSQVAFSDYPIDIEPIGNGVYTVSDLFGGYYDVRAAYGPGYAMRGIMVLNSDNTLSGAASINDGWGDSYSSFDNASYDTATGQVKWAMGYVSAYTFNVVLTK